MHVYVLGGCSVRIGVLSGDGSVNVCAHMWRPKDNSGLTVSNLSDSLETGFVLIGLEVPDYGKQTGQ